MNAAPNYQKKNMRTFTVAKLLLLSKRARSDIGLTIAFLCTRVSRSTEQDWRKLLRLLKYLQGTTDLPRIIGANNLHMMKTWVDAVYAIHHDMKSHTGGVMRFGTGFLNAKSTKLKLNTKSSTEAELVGANDYIPWTIWVKRFMKYQGYDIKSSIFYQDNESAIKLEENGRKSCGEKSRRIDIRYYFIKDVLKHEDIKIEHCRTDLMIADVFTKPLQGNLFRKFRNFIMGITSSLNEERVGNKDKCEASTDEATRMQTDEATRVPTKILTWAEVVRGKKRRTRKNDKQHHYFD